MPANVPPPVDENTGFGGWATVSVREYDEEEERLKEEAAAAKAAKVRLVSHPINQPIPASPSHPTIQPINRPTNRPTNQRRN